MVAIVKLTIYTIKLQLCHLFTCQILHTYIISNADAHCPTSCQCDLVENSLNFQNLNWNSTSIFSRQIPTHEKQHFRTTSERQQRVKLFTQSIRIFGKLSLRTTKQNIYFEYIYWLDRVGSIYFDQVSIQFAHTNKPQWHCSIIVSRNNK